MAYGLQNSKELYELLKDVYILTDMKICIYDANGREICYYPKRYTDFCRYLREQKQNDMACIACAKAAMAKCRAIKKPFIYTCYAGLTEGVLPILINDEIGGFIVLGQIREREEIPDFDAFSSIDTERLKTYYSALHTERREKIESALHVLNACASYEHLRRFVISAENVFRIQFENYVDAHLCDNLQIAFLMEGLHLSRMELYRRVEDCFECTPAEFIRKRRLHYAKKLLLETRLPVAEIAVRCGIGDYNYFSKLFKREYQMSPRQLRGKGQKI